MMVSVQVQAGDPSGALEAASPAPAWHLCRLYWAPGIPGRVHAPGRTWCPRARTPGIAVQDTLAQGQQAGTPAGVSSESAGRRPPCRGPEAGAFSGRHTPHPAGWLCSLDSSLWSPEHRFIVGPWGQSRVPSAMLPPENPNRCCGEVVPGLGGSSWRAPSTHLLGQAAQLSGAQLAS